MSRITLTSIDKLSDEQKLQFDRFPANLTLALLGTTGPPLDTCRSVHLFHAA